MQQFANNAVSTLTLGINDTDTVIEVSNGAVFPSAGGSDYFLVTLVGLDVNSNEASWEIVKCTSRTGNSLTVVRAQEGTPALSWSNGTRVELRLTAASIIPYEFLDGKITRTAATGSATVPAGTEAQRDGSPQAGYFRFNSDIAKFEGYNGTTWGSVGGGATGGGGNEFFIENDQVADEDYTIPAGKNALTTGPVSIDATITISDGSRWVII